MLGINIILGAIALLFGCHLFWAFVAIAGFLIGMEVAGLVLVDQAAWVQILVGIGFSAIGALVAIGAERFGFALAGFYAVGYLSVIGGGAVLPQSHPLVWFLLGGLAGAIVAALLMDWAIIVLSSLVGATAIVTQVKLAPAVALVALVGLIIVGIVFQSRGLRRERGAAE